MKLSFRIFFLVSVLFLSHSSFSQNKALIAQYEQQLTTAKEDEAKVDLLNKLVDEYFIPGHTNQPENYVENAKKRALDAANLAEKLNYKKGMARSYNQLADIYKYQNIVISYNKYRLKALKIAEEVSKIKEQEAEQARKDKEAKEAELKKQEQELAKQQEAARKKQEEIDRMSRDASVSKEEIARKKAELAKSQENIENQKTQIQEQGKALTETTEQLEQKTVEVQKTADQLKIVEQEKKLQEEEKNKQKLINYFLLAVIGFVIAFALLFLKMYRDKQKTNIELALKNKVIETEKQRSDELLLNILPLELANELKEKGVAQARHYEQVTVLFTDFKDFTTISEKLSPKQLVGEIDYCFRAFDNIIGKYGIEKIKTVGDAYLCAGGVPVPETHDPDLVVRAAMDIQKFMDELKTMRSQEGKPFFEIRIGMHTGPLVAGVVGSKKFAYDIWGDTVNTAARMEQNSEAGKVNISEATYELIKAKFSCTYRGKIAAKNKGEMSMYFVDHELVA